MLLPALSLNPEDLLASFGTVGLFAIVFAESGLLVGFFLPGDSLLFTAGLLASQGKLNLPVILAGCFVAAVAGDQVGYAFGSRAGPALFRRPDSRLFRQEHVERARTSSTGTGRRPSFSPASYRSCARSRRSWPGSAGCRTGPS